jgi:hypothetical protein
MQECQQDGEGCRIGGEGCRPGERKPAAQRRLGMYEIVMLVVFIAFGVLVCVMIVVVTTSIASVYRSLSRSASDYIDKTATDAADRVGTEVSGIGRSGELLSEVVGSALATPRVPDAAEAASYVVLGSSELDGGMALIYAADDRGGTAPAAVMYHTEGLTEAQTTSVVERYFWRTGGLGSIMEGEMDAWGSRMVQVYCITTDGFAILFPYTDLSQVFVDLLAFPMLAPANPTNNPRRQTLWTPPYIDSITLEWVVTFMHPLYIGATDGATGETGGTYTGTCGADVFISGILAYADSVSASLPWDAYVVIAAGDGTLLAIPTRGSEDWGLPPGLTYEDVCSDASYSPPSWNIFSASDYSAVGALVNESAAGRGTVRLPGGQRIIAWATVEGSGWISMAVIDEQAALATQRRAMIMTIVVASVLGTLLAVTVVGVLVYVAVTRQYARLSSKVHVLNEELVVAKKTIAVLSGADDDGGGSGVALTGGVPLMVATLVELSEETFDPEKARIIRDAARTIVRRNADAIRHTGALNADQLQFVIDCGMRIDADTASVASPDELDRLEVSSVRSASSRWVDGDPESAVAPRDLPYNQVDVTNWDFSALAFADDAEAGGGGGAAARGETAKTQSGTQQRAASPAITSTAMSIISTERLELSVSGIAVDAERLAALFVHMDADYCGTLDGIHCRWGSGEQGTYTNRSVFFADDGTDNGNGNGARRSNPYHNHLHAADVLQAFYCMLRTAFKDSPEFRASVTSEDVLACIIAAAGHDYGHPGVNNGFLRETLAPTHLMFTGESTLERMHVARTLDALFLRDGDNSPFANVPKRCIADLVAVVTKLVLATDMARHVEIMDAFSGWRGLRGEKTSFDSQGKMLVLQMLMKAADLSNAFRPWVTCADWANRVYLEFVRQGAAEKALGLPVSRFMDGSTTIAKTQDTFIPLIVLPLLSALAAVFPSFETYKEIASDNLKHWRTVA